MVDPYTQYTYSVDGSTASTSSSFSISTTNSLYCYVNPLPWYKRDVGELFSIFRKKWRKYLSNREKIKSEQWDN